MLGNGRVNNALIAKFIQHALGDFISPLVLANFLTHQEHFGVAAHFLRHGRAQSFPHGHRDHFGAFGDVWITQLWTLRGLLRNHLRVRVTFISLILRSAHSGRLERLGGHRCSANHRNRRIDFYALCTLGDENFCQGTFINSFHFHGGLVGFNFGNNVT